MTLQMEERMITMDAHEAGLARVFEMVDRSFRLGDHGRYPAC